MNRDQNQAPWGRRAGQLVLWLLCAASACGLAMGDGWIRLAGALGLATWLVLDTAVESRREGWQWALATHAGLVFVFGCFAAVVAEPLWANIVGWTGLFLAVFAFSAWSWQRRQAVPNRRD